MHNKCEVVVTGAGLVTPIGCSPDKIWSSLLTSSNAVKRLPEGYRSLKDYNIFLAGIARDFSFDECKLERKSKNLLKGTNLLTRMLVYAGLKAMENARLEYPKDSERFNIGAIIANGTAMAEQYDSVPFHDRNPKWYLETYPNLPLSYFSIIASLKGHGSTIVSACTGATQAIGECFKKIQRGEASVMLAGGVDNKFSEPFAAGFSRLNMTTPSQDTATASRPFDKKRDGFVIGQGACVLVLESLQNALNRKADIRGKIIGYGSSLDGISLTDATCDGKAAAMELSLKDADISSDQIDYINAHGTSTISNDSEESKAIKKVFGRRAYEIPVNSTKSMIGHTFAACGAIEAFVCMKSLETQMVHSTRGFEEGDDVCDLDYVKGGSRNAPMRYCMSNNSGLGGYNASLIFAVT